MTRSVRVPSVAHQEAPTPKASDAGWREPTRAYYEEKAADYAARTLRLSMAEPLRTFLAKLPQGAAVVDLGCGAGRDLRIMSHQGFSVLGVDLSEGLARLAADYSGAPVVVADMRQIPVRDGAFGGAWASASMLHLPRFEIPAALNEIRRILQRDGWLFTSVKVGSGEQQDSDGRWFSYFDPQGWRSGVRAAGFEVERLDVREGDSSHPDAPVCWINCWARRL